MRDLQRRLAQLGFHSPEDEPGHFGPGTAAAVRAFQESRRLRGDGVCGEQTWAALVEAGYRLGDRLLYLRQPMLRGDDVAALQERLGTLGFDAGRVDGIFGPNTKSALDEFQRNTGVTVDGVFGPATHQTLERLSARRGDREPVAAVREVENLRQASRTLSGKRVVVGDGGGLHAAAAAAVRVLTEAGAVAMVVQHPDQSVQAAEANGACADVYVGLRLDAEGAGCRSAHYAGHRYESPGGRRLAHMLQVALPPALGVPDGGVRGMAVPVLKETRMPAVLCELGPAHVVVRRTAELAAAVGRVLSAWAASPCDEG